MEENVYNVYKINNMNLIEINRAEVEGNTYVLFVNNEEPYPAYVAQVSDDNKFDFIKDKPLAIKILKEISKDKTTYAKFKSLLPKENKNENE